MHSLGGERWWGLELRAFGRGRALAAPTGVSGMMRRGGHGGICSVAAALQLKRGCSARRSSRWRIAAPRWLRGVLERRIQLGGGLLQFGNPEQRVVAEAAFAARGRGGSRRAIRHRRSAGAGRRRGAPAPRPNRNRRGAVRALGSGRAFPAAGRCCARRIWVRRQKRAE